MTIDEKREMELSIGATAEANLKCNLDLHSYRIWHKINNNMFMKDGGQE